MKQILIIFLFLMPVCGAVQSQSFLFELEDSLNADELVSVIRGPGISKVFDARVGLCGPK